MYSITNKITTGSHSSIFCGVPAPSGGPACWLQAANGASLGGMIDAGNGFTLRDMGIDGNQANAETSGSTAYLVDLNPALSSNYGRPSIENSTFQNSSGNGIVVPNVTVPKFSRDLIQFNNGDGISCSNSADLFMSDTEIEQNGLNGIELFNCPAARINHSDFGLNGSTTPGQCASSTPPSGYYGQLYIHGTATAWNSAGYQIISSNQFGNGCGTHIYIAGGSQNPTTFNTIVGNQFMGMNNTPALSAAQPQIYIVNGFRNQIVANLFGAGEGGVSYGVQFYAQAAGVSSPSTITGNTFDNNFTAYTDGNEDISNAYVANVTGTP